jgi:hypothetical protein
MAVVVVVINSFIYIHWDDLMCINIVFVEFRLLIKQKISINDNYSNDNNCISILIKILYLVFKKYIKINKNILNYNIKFG